MANAFLPPPFFPATMLLLKAGKKGGLRDCEAVGLFPIFLATPSLLPGHYAIIKGREEGRAGNRFGDEERRLMHLVPAPAVKLMKGRVLSRPGMKKCLGLSLPSSRPLIIA